MRRLDECRVSGALCVRRYCVCVVVCAVLLQMFGIVCYVFVHALVAVVCL